MTKEEAIKLIDTHTVCFYNEIDSPTLQALHLAIEALHREEAIKLLKWKEPPNFIGALPVFDDVPTIPMFAESEEAYKEWTGEEMGVYVKSVTHPRNCNECWLAFPNNDWDFTSHCRIIGEDCPDDGKLQNCPLADNQHGFTADEWYRDTFKGEEK